MSQDAVNLCAGHVSLEAIDCPAHILRVHVGGGGHGSPWERACVIQIDGDRALIKALSAGETFTSEMRRHIRDALLDLGITRAEWVRSRAGTMRKRSVDR